MDNSTCYWCDYPVNKIGTKEEGYYCTYSSEREVLCELEKPCFKYVSADKVSDYIRHLLKEIELMELTKKLP